MTREMECRDAVVADLKVKLTAAKAETASAMSEFGEQDDEDVSKISALQLEADLLRIGLCELRKKYDLYMAQFVDPGTGVQLRCPVIQNNGVVRSLGSVIDIWAKASDMGQSHAFRMFSCPITRSFVLLSSPSPIVDTVMKLAGAAGVDKTSPIVFKYKGVDGVWAEFPFDEQLELIARLCSVYKDHKNPMRPPEQLISTIPSGSIMILMRSVVCWAGFRLECFGVQNDGQGRVEIKLVFDPEWTHPFVDMDFVSDA